AKDILSLVIDKLREIDKNLNTKQWLEMIYCYCQFLSFPETSPAVQNINLPTKKIFTIFLLFYRFLVIEPHQLQKKYSASSYPLLFLTEKEISSLEQPAEYQKFLEAYNRLFVYEMMVLGKEIFGYNTCDHICGVHTLALSLARQLKSQGLFLDLGIISGAAAGHDIGKYGCKSNEQEKVPYLHYYYTDIWFQRQNIPYIGHIAVNHSVWDLELENLSLESLILIYSDFRVKNIPQTQEMYIYSLQDSFRIILEKLDNLDRQKERRYKRVFAKLQDFEEFLIEKGIETCPVLSDNTKKQKTKNSVSYSLLHGEEIIKHLKQLSLEHSFNLMYQLRNEPAVNSILELARSEKNWQNIQDYLRIFSEYSTYLNQKEKLFTLRFLYEKLIFPEEGIRRRSAKLIGYLIAGFDEKYRKEIPENVEIIPSKIKSYNLLGKYIQEIIEPKHKVPEMIYARVRENLAFVFEALFEKSQGRQIRDFRRVINGIYKKYTYKQISKDKAVCLLQAIRYIPFLLNENIDSVLVDFLDQFIEHKDDILRLNSLSVIEEIIDKLPEKDPFREKCQFLLINKPDKSVFPVENYLCYKLLTKTKNNQYLPKRFQEYCQQDKEKIDRMYLTNLKTSTDPIIKKIQIDILLEKAKTDRKEAVYTALHFCNIQKVSSHESIRNYAGKSLIKIIPYLNMEHKNDIAIELLKALEIDDYQYTKYIPYYLGQLIPFLPPGEIDEFIAEFEQKTKISDQWISVLLLRTIAVAISRYAPYQSRYNESSEKVEDRLKRMLGILMNGLVHQDSPVKRITSHAIGREIFASEHLTLREKSVILRFIAKKLLNLLSSISIQDSLLFFTNTVALHQIYVYMSDYIFFEGSLKLAVPTKVAFFPGSFDPFSTSHKEIVKEIEKMGIEVYLSVDEYSWSKRTQPHLYRKNLINMSIADELDVYLYPENLPNNIANPTNLKLLKKQFPFSKIYIVAGSDVLLNASAYSESNNIDSIMHFPHIIFSRKPFHLSSEQKDKYLSIMNKIKAEVIQLNLETPFEEISSSLIRKNIDNHRDITGLVDPLAERFIYQHSLYQREPQFKATLQKVFTEIEIIEKFKDSFIQSLVEDIFPDNLKSEVEKCLKLLRKKQNPRLIILKDTLKKERKLGFAAVHWVRSSLFY
ncbi:MAG: cytidyltransferase, partial [Atribacterota bacterium]|nr:cytidyltransferase [Atribacterota bacterium]